MISASLGEFHLQYQKNARFRLTWLKKSAIVPGWHACDIRLTVLVSQRTRECEGLVFLLSYRVQGLGPYINTSFYF